MYFRWTLSLLIISMILCVSGTSSAQEREILVVRSQGTHTITLSSADGHVAHIDFTNTGVVYHGDLPVEESAKLFLDAVNGLVCTQQDVAWSGMSFGASGVMYTFGARKDGIVVWRLQTTR